MKGSTIIFYLLSAIALISALLSVYHTENIQGCYLPVVFIGWNCRKFISGCNMNLLPLCRLLLYVGGITVLIIFSIFLTQQAGELLPVQNKGRFVFAGLAAMLGFILMLTLLFSLTFTGTSAEPLPPTVENVGKQMLGIHEGGYALPFEVVSVLLLAAMVGCIVIAMRSKSDPA
jgi:NADH-quinone oxidoreductase subunit J